MCVHCPLQQHSISHFHSQASNNNVTSGMVQNAVALLCNLSGDTILDLEPAHQQGTWYCFFTAQSEVNCIPKTFVTGTTTYPSALEIVMSLVDALLWLLHNITECCLLGLSFVMQRR